MTEGSPPQSIPLMSGVECPRAHSNPVHNYVRSLPVAEGYDHGMNLHLIEVMVSSAHAHFRYLTLQSWYLQCHTCSLILPTTPERT